MPPQEDACRGAISVALQHPRFSEDIQTICRMLQVCRSWRTAVQQAHPQGLAVVFSLQEAEQRHNHHDKLASFVKWLRKYASLLKCMTLDMPAVRLPGRQDLLGWCEVADGLLSDTLQLVATAAAGASIHDNNSAAIAGSVQALQLVSFKGINLLSPATVAALPAASLQQLHLQLPAISSEDGACVFQRPAALHPALSCLTGLRELNLTSCRPDCTDWALSCIPGQCIQALSGLRYLTQLKLEGVDPFQSRLQLLPAQLQQLYIWLQGDNSDEQTLVDLQHLTALQHLELSASKLFQPADKYILPTQLQTLDWGKAASEARQIVSLPTLGTANLSQLQHLQQLNMYDIDNNESDYVQQVQSLTGLVHLQHLGLAYAWSGAARSTAHLWQQLHQLRALEVHVTNEHESYDGVDKDCLLTVLHGIAAVPWLTRLSLVLPMAETDEFIDVCVHLTGLNALSHLRLSVACDEHSDGCIGNIVHDDDACHLTVLTRLTHLDLSNSMGIVDDFAAVALACTLHRLRHLSLRRCRLETMSVVAAIASHLTQLTCLDLRVQECELTFKQLMSLTTVTSLNSVLASGPTEEEWGTFWQALQNAS